MIFGDDIGQTNVSAYSMGLMGYHSPNIDRIAREGMIFTDEALRPARRPVRACRRHLQHVLRLVDLPAVYRLRRAGGDREVPRYIHGVPAPPAGRQLQHRSSSRKDAAESRQQLNSSVPLWPATRWSVDRLAGRSCTSDDHIRDGRLGTCGMAPRDVEQNRPMADKDRTP